MKHILRALLDAQTKQYIALERMQVARTQADYSDAQEQYRRATLDVDTLQAQIQEQEKGTFDETYKY